MSRMTAVRSTTRICSASSSRRCWRGAQLLVARNDLGPHLLAQLAQLLELALADVGGRVGAGPALHQRGLGLHLCSPQQLAHLLQRVVGLLRPPHGGDHDSPLGRRFCGAIGERVHPNKYTEPESAASGAFSCR